MEPDDAEPVILLRDIADRAHGVRFLKGKFDFFRHIRFAYKIRERIHDIARARHGNAEFQLVVLLRPVKRLDLLDLREDAFRVHEKFLTLRRRDNSL